MQLPGAESTLSPTVRLAYRVWCAALTASRSLRVLEWQLGRRGAAKRRVRAGAVVVVVGVATVVVVVVGVVVVATVVVVMVVLGAPAVVLVVGGAIVVMVVGFLAVGLGAGCGEGRRTFLGPAGAVGVLLLFSAKADLPFPAPLATLPEASPPATPAASATPEPEVAVRAAIVASAATRCRAWPTVMRGAAEYSRSTSGSGRAVANRAWGAGSASAS